jgi:hypothetical protein
MGKCPYCKTELSLEELKFEKLHGGYRQYSRMWMCPSCESILGFSEYKSK